MTSKTDSALERTTLKLFDFLRKAPAEPSTFETTTFLYGSDSPQARNRLYAIRNKLMGQIFKCLNYQHETLDQEQQLLNDFLVARVFLKRGKYGLARQVLDRALVHASKADLFHFKELAYRELLGLAGADLEVAVNQVVADRKENDLKLDFVRNVQNAMALILHNLRKTNFATGKESIMNVLEQLQQELQDHQDIFQSPKGRIRLFNLTSNLLLQQHAFPQLELYLKQEFILFEQKGYFDRSTHRTKIVMLNWLVNTTYKNLKFEESLAYCEDLKEAIESFGGLYRDQFILIYENGVTNNLIGLGRTKEAQKRLEALVMDEKLMQDDRAVYLLVNLAEIHFELEKVGMAIKTLAKSYLHHGFQVLDEINQLSIYVFELILRFEVNDNEYLEHRIEQVRGWFKGHLIGNTPAAMIIEKLALNNKLRLDGVKAGNLNWEMKLPEAGSQTAFLPGENEIIDYRLWIQSKQQNISYRVLAQQTIQAEIEKRNGV